MGPSEPVGLTMAKWAVERGALVIPAYINKNLDKMPLIKGWQNSGSREVAQLERWWEERPWANVGVLGGRGSWAVWDCDGREAVDEFRTLCNGVSGIGWDRVLLYKTPGRKDLDGTGGGLHCMWRWPEWLGDLHKAEIKREGWRGGLEFRGRGTWTLLPCNRRDGEYEILNAPDEIDEMPRGVWDAFSALSVETPISAGYGDLREISPEEAWEKAPWSDGRKNAVAAIAWHLSIRGSSEEEVMEVCSKFAQECCTPCLEQGVVERKVSYTWQRAAAALEKTRQETEAWTKAKENFLTA